MLSWPIGTGPHPDGIEVRVEELITDPDPSDTTIESRITYTIWEDGVWRTERDVHICGLFSVAEWITMMEETAFETEVLPLPGDGDGCGEHLFVGLLACS